ncbi:TldD/PmbA family protein [Bacillus sp. B-jedd]|uniref:TldD/PmbA family protein n=1 Tax=Bacillus sp. B-jedd TaxID=1476857 RepID=UPI0005156398|nr:TldD/PmbA family protein [Bacillus sp. B-jedd]CEG29389.1 suppressor of the inhibitory activity of the cabon storage regulator (CsrA) [Bacillus sp. B-jedd]
MMDIRGFQTELFKRGKEQGFSEMEIYFSSNKAISISVFQREIEEYTIIEQGGVSFRGLYNGQMGYSYAEKVDRDSIGLLLEEAKGNSLVLEVEDGENLFEGSKSYAEPMPYSESLAKIDAETLIEAAFRMEKAAYDFDKRIDLVNSCGISKTISEMLIANTFGLNCHRKTAYISAGIYLVAKDGESTATGGDQDFTLTDFSKLDFQKIAEKGAKEAISKLNAESIESGQYPVIFRYDTASSLLGSYLDAFSADSVQKGYSKLIGRLNEQIAGSNITIIDDPTMSGVPGNATFDSEGFATKRKELIKDGLLANFLHNRKTAKKDGVESTGNAVKGGFQGTIGVGPYNVYLEPGDSSFDELIAKTDKGIVIVELQGENAGINPLAGDFSLAAIGFLVEDGKIVRPIDQFTIAGNFFELLNEIEEIGNDLTFRSSINFPSIKVKALSITGNK